MKKTITSLLVLGILSACSLKAQESSTSNNPAIALLGMFHFGETSDLGAIKMKDLRGERRQTDIKDMVEKLKAYGPTKILVEYPFVKQDTLQARYEAYLAGDFELRDSETYQIGFRLAKSLGHKTIYGFDHKMDLPFDELSEHLAKTGEMEKMTQMVGAIQQLMQAETAALDTLSLAEYLLRLNSENFDALANSLYLKEVLDMGSPDNEVGAKISAIWYQRNMLMLKNIDRCIEAPDERILAIVGSSHRAVIKDYIQDRVDLSYEEIADYIRKE